MSLIITEIILWIEVLHVIFEFNLLNYSSKIGRTYYITRIRRTNRKTKLKSSNFQIYSINA